MIDFKRVLHRASRMLQCAIAHCNMRDARVDRFNSPEKLLFDLT
jgi:hypothetical protein